MGPFGSISWVMRSSVRASGRSGIAHPQWPPPSFPLLEAPAAFMITRGSIGMGRSPGTSAKV